MGGVSEGWTWRKWNSGTIELWRIVTDVDVILDATTDGIFRACDNLLTLPFPILKVQSYGIIEANGNANVCPIWVCHCYFMDDNNVPMFSDDVPATRIMYDMFTNYIPSGIPKARLFFSVKARWK